MLLPILAVLAIDLSAATPLLVGLAVGAYGLLQAFLQIPFGMLSDRFGRKKILLVGLLLFTGGSVIAALADSIYGIIAGRALQGAGAISAVIMALAADLTREHMRTQMMAILGASIGLSFILSMVIGPLLMGWLKLSGIFALIAGLAVAAMALVQFVVPEPTRPTVDRDIRVSLSSLKPILRNRQLLRLDAGVCLLHLLITATFVAIPLALLDAGFELNSQWRLYLYAIALSLLIVLPLVGMGERCIGARATLLIAITGLALAQVALVFVAISFAIAVLGLALFVGFLSVLEALLPSLVSRLAPSAGRGTAMGVYSTWQFLGAFIGGVTGGCLVGYASPQITCLVLSLLCLLWLAIAWGMDASAQAG